MGLDRQEQWEQRIVWRDVPSAVGDGRRNGQRPGVGRSLLVRFHPLSRDSPAFDNDRSIPYIEDATSRLKANNSPWTTVDVASE
jgi:hypothetical protein